MNFYIKPIFWNTKNYEAPSGEISSAGYPHDFGFGHEEWNNSKRMSFSQDGKKYQAFHAQHSTMGIATEEPIFIFFIASHDGVQQLVGIAGSATSLDADESRREELVKKLGIQEFWKDAWGQESVKSKFDNDIDDFREHWNDHVNWTPNFLCPSELFLWLDEPVDLNPVEISGKSKLISMFGSHQSVDAAQSLYILRQIPKSQRDGVWETLHDSIYASESTPLAKDIENLENQTNVPETIKIALINARRGQGKYRRELEKRWDGKCAFSGSGISEVNRASHIKAWKDCDDKQRLDPCNGLLLAAHLDALFDRGLISFSSSGEILILDRVSSAERELFGLSGALRKPLFPEEQNYLRHHRKKYGFSLE